MACTADSALPPSAGLTTPAPDVSPESGANELVLPIDAYEMTGEQQQTYSLARTYFVGSCMRDFGFTFDERVASAGADESLAERIMDFGHYGNKRRYGLGDPEIAAKYGYHLISSIVGTAPERGGNDPHGFGEMTPQKQELLYGRTADGRPLTQQVNGKNVPQGGCLGVADKRLAEAGDPGGGGLAAKISHDSFARAHSDPAVLAVFEKWSACMRATGYTYTDPAEAGSGFDVSSKTVSADEVAMALTDIDCKQKNDVIAVWADFEVKYQNEQIEHNAEELAAVKAGYVKLFKNLADVVGH